MCRLFFFTAPSTTEFYTLSLHDALPIFRGSRQGAARAGGCAWLCGLRPGASSCSTRERRSAGMETANGPPRSEEHTSELQSQSNLVCRLLLEKKKKTKNRNSTILSRIT